MLSTRKNVVEAVLIAALSALATKAVDYYFDRLKKKHAAQEKAKKAAKSKKRTA